MMNAKYLLISLIFLVPVFSPAQIYDCFLFYNELELLNIRLYELYDHVDKFVLVESEETFRQAQTTLLSRKQTSI